MAYIDDYGKKGFMSNKLKIRRNINQLLFLDVCSQLQIILVKDNLK
jgi:hypothetical protein